MSFRRDPCSPKVSPTYEGFLKDLKQSTNDTEKGGKKKKPSLHSNSEITSLNINSTANSVPRTDNKTRREASKRNSSTSVSTVHHTREDGAEGGSVANPNGGDTSGNNPNPGSDAVSVNTLTEADLLYYRTSYDCRALLGNITLAENADLRLKYFSHVGQCAEKDVEEYVKRKAALAGEGQNIQNDNSNHNNNNTANSGKKNTCCIKTVSSPVPSGAASTVTELEGSRNANVNSSTNSSSTKKYVDPKYYTVTPNALVSKTISRASLTNKSGATEGGDLHGNADHEKSTTQQREESIEQWFDILIKGSQDAWSRVRQESLKYLAELLPLYVGNRIPTVVEDDDSEEEEEEDAVVLSQEMTQSREECLSDCVTVRSSGNNFSLDKSPNRSAARVRPMPSSSNNSNNNATATGAVTPVLAQTPRQVNSSGDRGLTARPGGTTPRVVTQSGALLKRKHNSKKGVLPSKTDTARSSAGTSRNTPRTFTRSGGVHSPPPQTIHQTGVSTPRDQINPTSSTYLVRSTSAPASRRGSRVDSAPTAIRRTATPSTPHRSSRSGANGTSPNPLRHSFATGETTPLGATARSTNLLSPREGEGEQTSRLLQSTDTSGPDTVTLHRGSKGTGRLGNSSSKEEGASATKGDKKKKKKNKKSGEKSSKMVIAKSPEEMRRRDLLQNWISKLLKRWSEEGGKWYVKEGLLRVIDTVVPFFVTSNPDDDSSSSAVEKDVEQTFHSLLTKVVFPALREAQLPVREAAVRLLERLLQLCSSLRGFVVDHVISTLSQFEVPNPQEKNLTPEEEKTTYAVLGYLQVISTLSRLQLISPSSPSMISVIMIFAAYPASSVRQCVAEALCPPSVDLFIFLLVQLAEFPYSEPPQPWQAVETVLMILQQHLKYYLKQPVVDGDTLVISSTAAVESNIQHHRSRYYKNMTELMRSAVLSLIFQSNQKSNKFEVARMGKEVLPYVLQLWCRYADGAAALRDMFNAMESMILQDEQDDEAEGVEGELLLEERVIVNTVVLPWLWWFTAVRKEHVKSRRQPDDATPLVFDVVVDILQRSRVSPLLRGFSLPEEGKEADPRTTDQNKDGGSRLILPVILNLLVAYFGDELRLLSSEQRQVYLSAFLDPAMWSTLLTKYPQTGLKYTLDSIPSVLRVTAEGDSHEAEESVIQHIIPTMLRQVNQLQTYLQCIVLANLSTLLLEHTAVRKYRYVYQSIFAAPALLDGGEDLALGYTWLKQVNTGGQDTIDFVNTNIRRLTFHKLTGAAETVVTLLFQQLYCNTGVEPSVLREIRSFIEKFVCQMWQEDPSSESSDPSHSVALKKRLFQFCVAAVLDRLNAVSKKDSWVDQVDGAKGATAAASKDSWDDWDDDEDEGGVDSMDVAEEVRCAKQTFANIIARSDVVNSKEKFLALCEGNEHIPREQLVLLL